MKKIVKVLSMMLVILILTNTSVLAFSDLPANEFDFDIKVIDEDTISIRENGEEYIIDSIVKDNLMYNYLKDNDGNVINYTVYDSLKGETFFSTTGETIKIAEIDKQISTFSYPGSSKDNPVKACNPTGSTKQQNFNYTYNYIMRQTGRVVAVGTVLLVLLGFWGVSVEMAISNTKAYKLSAAIAGVIAAHSTDIKYLTSHGVKGITYKVCKLKEIVHTTGEFSTWIQDWDIDSISWNTF